MGCSITLEQENYNTLYYIPHTTLISPPQKEKRVRNMVEVGEKAPDFTLPNQDFNPVSLSDLLRDGKPVILVFFPAAFSPVCTNELCNFRDRMALLEKANARVVAISVDLPFSLKEFKEKNRLGFDLLSDFNKEVINKYGIVLEDLKGLKGLAKRAVFIIDKDGKVAWKWVSDDPLVEPDYDEVIKRAMEVAGKGSSGSSC